MTPLLKSVNTFLQSFGNNFLSEFDAKPQMGLTISSFPPLGYNYARMVIPQEIQQEWTQQHIILVT